MRTIEFEGKEYEYDDRCVMSWKWQKAINSNDSTRVMGAVERLFAGRDEEYADALSGNEDPEDLDTGFEKLVELARACTIEAGSKN